MTDSHDDGARPQTFRRANRLFFAPWFAIGGGGMGTLIVVETARARVWAVVCIGAFIITLSLVTAVAILRVAVVVDSNGLLVRNLLSTRRVGWSQLRGVSPASADPMRYVRILLTDGHVIRCDALAPMRFGGTAVLDRMAHEIQGAIDTLRSPDPSV